MDAVIVGIEAMRIGRKSSICCLRIAECEPATPRIVPAELEENRVFDLWGAAQHDIWRAWMVETDPANLQPKLRPLNRQSRRIHPRHLPVPRPRHPRHRLRTALPASQEDQHHPPCSPAKTSASRRSTRAFGSQASCTTISDTSTWSRRPCNHSTTRSARGCHPCLRYDLLPMCPGWTNGHAGGEGGIRTHGTLSRTHAFQACALNHSATSPWSVLLTGGGAFSSERVGRGSAAGSAGLRSPVAGTPHRQSGRAAARLNRAAGRANREAAREARRGRA